MMNAMDTIKKFLSSKINLVGFSAQLLVMGVIFSITFFLLSINLFKTYRADISILVVMKSEIAQKQAERIISNIIEVPKTLSFYDRLLKQNPDVRDITAELTAEKRKEEWNEMISVRRVQENASVFEISINAKNESDSKQLASKSARTLFDTLAFYYNIKKDIDLRIIDGPISKAQVSGFYWILFFSVVGGFALATSLNFFFLLGKEKLKDNVDSFKKHPFFDFKKEENVPVEEEIESLKNLYQQEQVDAPFVFEEENEEQQILPSDDIEKISEEAIKFQEIKKITKELEPGKYPNYPEMPNREKQSEVVPDNLPIAEDEFFAQYEIPQQIVADEVDRQPVAQIIEQEKPIEEIKKEPTQDEMKKRLNQLLKGSL